MAGEPKPGRYGADGGGSRGFTERDARRVPPAHRNLHSRQPNHRGDRSMSINFYVWDEHWQTGRRHKVSVESWPGPFADPYDKETEFARDYAARWSENEFFPDHPCRDKDGKIVLPESLDQSPEAYVEANAPLSPPRPEPMQLPYAGKMNIV